MSIEYIVSEPVNISQFMVDWVQKTTFQDISDVPMNDEFVINPLFDPKKLLNINSEKPEFLKSVPDNMGLVTLQHRMEDLKHREYSKLYLRRSLEKFKYYTSDAPWKHSFINMNPDVADRNYNDSNYNDNNNINNNSKDNISNDNNNNDNNDIDNVIIKKNNNPDINIDNPADAVDCDVFSNNNSNYNNNDNDNNVNNSNNNNNYDNNINNSNNNNNNNNNNVNNNNNNNNSNNNNNNDNNNYNNNLNNNNNNMIIKGNITNYTNVVNINNISDNNIFNANNNNNNSDNNNNANINNNNDVTIDDGDGNGNLEKVMYPEVLISVHVYRPYRRSKRQCLEQEFDVLGSNTLTSFRDRIYCLADVVVIGDFNENPDIPITVTTKDVYKSGFLFIEGTFYNDMRCNDNIDYSQTIKEWADQRPEMVGPFTYASMEGVQFRDLTLRIGQPYLYMHQGNCEHLIVFTDIRMLSGDECVYKSLYPFETFKSRERKIMCRACNRGFVRWVTINSQLSPEDPCYFCDMCLKTLHYDAEGNLIDGSVLIMPYPGRDVK